MKPSRNVSPAVFPRAAKRINAGAIHAKPATPIFGNAAAQTKPANAAKKYFRTKFELAQTVFNLSSLPKEDVKSIQTRILREKNDR